MSYRPRVHSGPSPADEPVTCPDCRKVRYFTPSERTYSKSDRCASCASRLRWRNKLRQDRGLPPEE